MLIPVAAEHKEEKLRTGGLISIPREGIPEVPRIN